MSNSVLRDELNNIKQDSHSSMKLICNCKEIKLNLIKFQNLSEFEKEKCIPEDDIQVHSWMSCTETSDKLQDIYFCLKYQSEQFLDIDKGNLLTPNQRRKYAEKATLSFWRAIGGNSDEIDDSSDTDVET
ncbi:Hypothetical predicted protein [Octopus vulgaris]|uniref:Uncharacterized protein n=1 Tax=Octopus vulgaris TaxID=6645 RepID=A0AA36BB09_OCTVU|nr:Hypothetical predicted protein [Octopus vulgaris]